MGFWELVFAIMEDKVKNCKGLWGLVFDKVKNWDGYCWPVFLLR